MPEHYFCQSCRIAMADPFWQAESIQLIPPALLRSVPGRPVVIRPSGKDQVMAVERAFNLMPAQLEPLRKNTQTEQLHVCPRFSKASHSAYFGLCAKCQLQNAIIHCCGFLGSNLYQDCHRTLPTDAFVMPGLHLAYCTSLPATVSCEQTLVGNGAPSAALHCHATSQTQEME